MNYTCSRWLCWGGSGLIFAVDTTVVIADPAHAGHPLHGVVRLVALAAFVLGGFFWVVDTSQRMRIVHVPVRQEHVYMGRVPQLEPAPTVAMQKKAVARAYVDTISAAEESAQVLPLPRHRHDQTP
jgi:hypothetical protein